MKVKTYPELDLTYEKIGEVFISRDTANVVIQVENMGQKYSRFLVTFEFVELIDPKKNCFEASMNKILEEIGPRLRV